MATLATGKLQLAACQLVLIDIQEKLTVAMPPERMQHVNQQASILLQAAQHLAIPIVVTEQYPKGLGNTLPALKALMPHAAYVEKTAFSACGEAKFTQKLHRDLSQVVLFGLEAHICVLQTALDLTAMGKQVFVVEDAVISRAAANQTNAIARLRDAGCIVTNTESVLFECLGGAHHSAFKAVSALIK